MLLLRLFEAIKMDIALSQLGWIDLVVVILLILGAIIGFTRGLKHQFPLLISLVATAVVPIHYYDRISQLVTQHSSISPVVSQMASFFLLAICTNLVVKFILTLCAKLGNIDFIYSVERIGGSLIGICRYILLFSLISFFINILTLPVINELYSTRSLSGHMIMNLSPKVHDYSVSVIKGLIKEIRSSDT